MTRRRNRSRGWWRQDSGFAHFAHDFFVENLVAIRLQHARHQVLLTILPERISDENFLFGEAGFEQKRVPPVEFGLRELLSETEHGMEPIFVEIGLGRRSRAQIPSRVPCFLSRRKAPSQLEL